MREKTVEVFVRKQRANTGEQRKVSSSHCAAVKVKTHVSGLNLPRYHRRDVYQHSTEANPPEIKDKGCAPNRIKTILCRANESVKSIGRQWEYD